MVNSKITPKDVKEIRQRMKLSQTKFAKLIGTTQNTIYRWEFGIAVPIKIFQEKIIETARQHGIDIDGEVGR